MMSDYIYIQHTSICLNSVHLGIGKYAKKGEYIHLNTKMSEMLFRV